MDYYHHGTTVTSRERQTTCQFGGTFNDCDWVRSNDLPASGGWARSLSVGGVGQPSEPLDRKTPMNKRNTFSTPCSAYGTPVFLRDFQG